MNYYISSPELDALIKEIRLKIRLSMNGIVSEQMIQGGIIYKKNFGVSIPRIKEIASTYTPDHNLAHQLWNLKIRETMIMATLLEPIDKFSLESATKWVADFNQIEIVEQTVMNLFCKLPFANKISSEWVQSNQIWIQITGFMLSARIVNSLNPAEIKIIIVRGIMLSNSDNFHLYKAISHCLARFCRKNKEVASSILKEIELFSNSSISSQQYILKEVKQELLFLDLL
jgi:3-methyladenine DNA glycosylase AlkD